jgi:hypothetical protein
VEILVKGKNEPVTLKVTPPVFDNEQGVQLFRRLPLKVGYKANLPIVTSLGGNKITIPVTVSKTETLTVPAGSFECYQLELGLIGQTFWISTDEHRYVVRFAAGGVTAELAEIAQHKPGEDQALRGENYSFTLPAGWLAYRPENAFKNSEGSKVFLLDPAADCDAMIDMRKKQSLKDDQRSSPRKWTESVIGDFRNVYSDFAIRDPGLKDIKVSGRPATVLLADYTKNGRKQTVYGVAVFGEHRAATLRFSVEADKFDKLRKDFDKIVESFVLE